MAVASILVKNGYKVFQGKERKAPSSKAYVYFLDVEKVDTEKETKQDEG